MRRRPGPLGFLFLRKLLIETLQNLWELVYAMDNEGAENPWTPSVYQRRKGQQNAFLPFETPRLSTHAALVRLIGLRYNCNDRREPAGPLLVQFLTNGSYGQTIQECLREGILKQALRICRYLTNRVMEFHHLERDRVTSPR